jgi:hypothetical protein
MNDLIYLITCLRNINGPTGTGEFFFLDP